MAEAQAPLVFRKEPPHWTHLVPVFIAIISLVQVFGLAWLSMKVGNTNAAVQDTTVAVNKMEEQINSNMERQIRQAIGEALAKERLQVEEKKVGGKG